MSYSSVLSHGGMVFDQHRNSLYAQAIGKSVRPESVVLDLGAGLGLHGLLAAGAGAARVYLVEPQPIVNLAKEAARASGFGVTALTYQGRIEDVRLPGKVDLIVSVFTGNLLFSEDLLPSLFYARDHYLKHGGGMLPDRAELRLAPLNAPDLHAKYVGRWGAPLMGLDYSSVRSFAASEILWLRREDLRGSQRLGEGAVLADLDLSTATSGDCRGESECHVVQDGLCHGLLGWIRIRLGDEWLSTAPDEPEVHWSPVVLPLDPPLPLVAGEALMICLRRPAFGDWTWSVRAKSGVRRHSTFLSKTDGPLEMARMALGARPGLSERGRRAARTLELLAQGLSVEQTVRALSDESSDPAQLLFEVQRLALKYGAAE